MPIIKGRYYMNPQYGAALERDREADAQQTNQGSTWLDYFLGFAEPNGGQEETEDPTSDVDSRENQSAQDLDTENRADDSTRQDSEQNTGPEKSKDIAATAGKYNGSTAWAFNTRKGAFAQVPTSVISS